MLQAEPQAALAVGPHGVDVVLLQAGLLVDAPLDPPAAIDHKDAALFGGERERAVGQPGGPDQGVAARRHPQ